MPSPKAYSNLWEQKTFWGSPKIVISFVMWQTSLFKLWLSCSLPHGNLQMMCYMIKHVVNEHSSKLQRLHIKMSRNLYDEFPQCRAMFRDKQEREKSSKLRAALWYSRRLKISKNFSTSQLRSRALKGTLKILHRNLW